MKLFISFVFSILLPSLCFSQSDLKFYHLTREDGLSQSTVNDILQDYEGFFWFCTDDGVNKWNGYDFKHYNYEENNENSLALGRASVILQDEDSVIWVGSRQGGISKYVKEADHFMVYQIEQGAYQQNKTGYNYITSMIPFRGNLLVGTLDNGLHFFNKKTETFIQIKLIQNDGSPLPLPIEFRIVQSSDSTLWLAHSKGVLRVKDITLENTDQFTFRVEQFHQGNNVLAIYEDSFGTMWFGTLESGAFNYNPITNKTSWIRVGHTNRELNSPIVRCFNEDNHGNLWIGTAGGGLNIYNFATKKFTYYLREIGNKYTIGSNSIYNIYQSPDSNMWVGTYNGGVSYTNWYKQSFNHIRGFGAAGDLSNNSILSICESPNGNIWFGTDGGGINILNPETGTHSQFNFLKDRDVNVVKSLKTDSKGNVYIGTYRDGLFIYNIPTGNSQHVSTATTPRINCPDIWDIALNKTETIIWLGTLGEGLIKYTPSTKKVAYFKNNADSLHSISHNYISVLFVDSNDNVWIGTFNAGISMLPQGKGREFINYRADSISNISSNEIFAIYEDSKGNILAGTHEGGLNILNKKTNTFVVYRHNKILKGSTVYGITEDDQGYIWLSTDAGLTKLNVISADSVDFIKHFSREGLLANEFNQHSVVKSSKGRLFFGGVNGYNSVIPSQIPVIKTIGQTIITKCYVFDNKVESNAFRTGLINQSKGLRLDPWQTTLSFEFAVMDYTLPELNTYEYKLEGFDKEWKPSAHRRRVTYTNIDPATYTFKVRGINSQGIIDSTPATFTFTIKKPFYQTVIFKVLIALVLILMVFAFYRIRIRVYRNQEDVLKRKVGERTSELLSLNKVLEARNEEINKQSIALRRQQEKLVDTNKALQNSYQQIETQNTELENHRNNLEDIVKERTIELEAAKIKAEESEQLKMAFLSNMSHEIRTPMNAIVGFASILASDNLTTEERDEYISHVEKNSDSLLVLIDDILDLSKIEANQLQLNELVFDLTTFMQEVFLNWQRLHTNKQPNVNILFLNKIETDSLFIKTDSLRIRQIINNLLDNAIKFTSKGKIQLTLALEKESIEISVEDTGIGISEKDITHIFNRFRKIEKSEGQLYRGAGLGLTISSKLAVMMGGKLSVSSQVNKGSTFYLTLPTSLITTEIGLSNIISKKPTLTVELPPLKVLIAEDEETNFLYLKGVLEKRKALVDRAKDGYEAFELAIQNNYDLILMDIKMPNLDGVEATIKIKEKLPNQLIFAQTAFARLDEVEDFKKAGFDEYLTKPIKINTLLKVARKYF